ncbi:hypothetical protein DSO57_1025786 [Entomophthora muscae]|uniref:Uncharacterized protein n=1 Tax=Entomophthora muscae TaxID=34485 RepID=A0ACC2SFB0_9FUNG|nr:hypothetical protein DSO57_1025786 [Entomophthora muscae]
MAFQGKFSKNYTAPPIYTSTNYYRDDAIVQLRFGYSRANNPNTDLLETRLGEIFNSDVVSYSSGSAAVLAAFFLYKPARVWIEHSNIDAIPAFKFISKIFPVEIKILPKASEFRLASLDFQEKANELIWVELLSLSTGRLSDYYELVKGGAFAGFKVAADASYCPPPFSFPLKQGFDIAIYSKADVILGPNAPNSGFATVNSLDQAEKLNYNRTLMGPVLGNLDAWNSIRCLKTYALRSQSQSETTREVFRWLKGESWTAIKDAYASDLSMMKSYLPPIISIQVSILN